MSQTEAGAEHILIAIDGPAASGKSSVAKALAHRLRFVYVNTGAMYRGITWQVLESECPPEDPTAIAALVTTLLLESEVVGTESLFLIEGVDPTPHLLSAPVTSNVSRIAAVPEVRRRLVELQRTHGETHDVVMEGRDIGSAVFPDTPYKFYIDASAEVRAQRRARQGLQDSILSRDRQDSSRRSSPLIIAEDAHVIDSSNLTIDGVVGEIVGRLKLRGMAIADPWL